MSDCAQTPLLDLLRSVPLDARLSYKHSPTDYSMIPAGRLCNEAADEIEALRELLRICRAERDELAAKHYEQTLDAARYRWIRDPHNMRARELVQYYGDVEPTELDVAIDMAMLPATPKAPEAPARSR